MVTVHPHILSISSPYEAFLLDAYGVFWDGNAKGLIPGAQAAMAELVANGKTVGVLSNSSQLSQKEIDKLNSHGLVLGTHFHFLVTSGEVAKSIFLEDTLPFKTPKGKFWLSSPAHPKYSKPHLLFEGSRFTEAPSIEEADFIYVSIPHIEGDDREDPDLFLEQVQNLYKSGLPMVCANPDLFAHEGNPPKAVVRQGTIAKMYNDLGGDVFYIGKPHQAVYLVAMQHFEKHGIKNPQNVLMVGDTPGTDILGASRCGMPSALITQTGIFAEQVHRKGLNEALILLPVQPNFLIQRLGSDGI